MATSYLAHTALGHKLWLGALPRDYCHPSILGPLLERPPGSPADVEGAPRLRLRDLQLSVTGRCAVATYATRLDAWTALEALSEPVVTPSSLGARPFDLVVGWALKLVYCAGEAGAAAADPVPHAHQP